MRESILKTKSYEFCLKIIAIYRYLILRLRFFFQTFKLKSRITENAGFNSKYDENQIKIIYNISL